MDYDTRDVLGQDMADVMDHLSEVSMKCYSLESDLRHWLFQLNQHGRPPSSIKADSFHTSLIEMVDHASNAVGAAETVLRRVRDAERSI